MIITDCELKCSNGDAGNSLEGKCPECGDTIIVSENQWWIAECSCGITWSMDYNIVGVKHEM